MGRRADRAVEAYRARLHQAHQEALDHARTGSAVEACRKIAERVDFQGIQISRIDLERAADHAWLRDVAARGGSGRTETP